MCRWLTPAVLTLLYMSVMPASGTAQQIVECDQPALVRSLEPNLALLGLSFVGINTGVQPYYATATTSCRLVTEKGPRAFSLYKHCPNHACQGGLEYGGIGVIASLEANLRSRMRSRQGTAWFGFQARTGVTSASSDRKHLEGWQRVELLFLNAVLPLPVQRMWVDRLDEPASWTQTYGVPFHTTRWQWARRKVTLSSVVPTPIGDGAITLGNDDTGPALPAAQTGTRDLYYKNVVDGLGPARGDWDWYLSPSAYWKTLDLKTSWSLDFASPPAGKNLGFAEATIRAFVTGSLTGSFHHQEGDTWTLDTDQTLPQDVFRGRGTLTTANMEQATAALRGGLRLAMRTLWHEWREEWVMPLASNTGPATWTGTRTTGQFEVFWGSKYATRWPALTTCSSTPAPLVPQWITLTMGSPVPPPDDDSNPDVPGFATRVGQTVRDSFVVCPQRALTSSDYTALENIRLAYNALRFRDPVTARRNACASLTTWYRERFAICRRNKDAAGPVVAYRRGQTSCDLF